MDVRLSGYENISTIDYLGKLSTVFFFSGCNYRCRFCYNHMEIYENSGSIVELSKILDIIEENSIVVDAVVCTGGEPCLQREALMKVLEKSKECGLSTMVDTNGSRPEVLMELVECGLVDRVAIDAKAPFNWRWREMVGVNEDPRNVLESMRIVGEDRLEVRTTVVPDSQASPHLVPKIVEAIKCYTNVYFLQQFDSSNPLDEKLRGIETVDRDTLIALANYASLNGIETVGVKLLSGELIYV